MIPVAPSPPATRQFMRLRTFPPPPLPTLHDVRGEDPFLKEKEARAATYLPPRGGGDSVNVGVQGVLFSNDCQQLL